MGAPTVASRPKLAVLDTNVLFHLAENYAPAHNLVLRLIGGGITSVVTQTVVQELAHAEQYADTPHKQEMARISLVSMLAWHIQPITLRPVGNGICEIVCGIIAQRNLLPAEEKNDACILIEAGFCGAAMLLTWDDHLLSADNAALNGVLTSFDLHPVQILHPKSILQY